MKDRKRSPTRQVLPFTLALLLAGSCHVPFVLTERAGTEPGISFGTGTGVMHTSYVTSRKIGPASWPDFHPSFALTGSARVRYGLSDRAEAFVQADGLTGTWLEEGAEGWRQPGQFAFSTGAKFRIGEGSALRFGVGVPGGLTCHLLHDAREDLSVQTGIGLGRATLGLGWHPRLNRRLLGHVVGGIGLPPSAAVGLGIEASPGRHRR